MNDKQIQKQNACALQAVLKTPQGRRVLYRILQAAQIHTHGFVAGDSHATAFHCGQRSIGLFLWEEIRRAVPEAYTQMEQEYQAEVNALQKEINRQQEEL